jgi:hypothetical protein
MPTQDEIMVEIIELVRTGAGAPLSAEAESALRDRYYRWICAVKKGNSTSPQDIWETDDGKRIKDRIKHIGKRLGEKIKDKARLEKKDYHETCRGVEIASACPHCPDPDPIDG